MTRKKVKLAYITNDSARKATFKKRKKGIMKKIWPSQIGVQRVISNFKSMPEMEQNKKMVNQDNFLKQKIVKANEQLKKQRRDNREKEMTQVMFQCLIGRTIEDFSLMDLNDMGWLINQYLKDIEKKTKMDNQMVMGGSSALSSTTALLPIALPPPAPTLYLNGIRTVGESSQVTNQQQQQWFMELMNPQDQQQMGIGGGRHGAST